MNFEHKKVDPSNNEFLSLVHELNCSLSEITSDSGQSSFVAEIFDSTRDGCIVVYFNGEPVACGVFRHHAHEICEIKRMFSKLRGAGTYLIKQLEACAIAKGYRKAVLSTRKVNNRAVIFYQRNSYLESKAYGKYTGVDRSICLSKELLT